MSDAVMIAIVGGIATAVVAAFGIINTLLTAKMRNSADKAAIELQKAAVKVEQVRETLKESTLKTDTQLCNIGQVVGSTHLLVNSQFSLHLKSHMDVTRALANIYKANRTEGWEAAEEAAKVAEKAYREHVAAQAGIDKTSVVTQAMDGLKGKDCTDQKS